MTAAGGSRRGGVALARRRRGWDQGHVRAAAIAAGGAVGALLRVGVAEALPHASGTWPWATFSVNLAGTALLAWATTRLAEVAAPTRYWRFGLGTGLCGALTTFSAFQVEALELAGDGHAGLALGYVCASLAAGMATAVAATVLARRRRYG